jgi:hypothetical protein
MKQLPQKTPDDVGGGYAIPIPCTEPPYVPGQMPSPFPDSFPCPAPLPPEPVAPNF